MSVCRFLLFAGVFLFQSALISQTIPFPQYPDWESDKSGRSTGLGLADIDGDGWKDIIIANGNDMARQRLVVYYNKGDGTFPESPDWSSDDIDYHGHLAVGDINGDGWNDVAVSVYIGPAGFSEPGRVKVYYNTGGELEAEPSFSSYPFYTFACALGDADGDGDLDLATTGGEPYSGLYDEGKIFINENGTYDSIPLWETDHEFGSLDVDFGDIDRNGFMDVVFTAEATPNFIFLANQYGQIGRTFDWYSADEDNFINSLDIGKTGASEMMSVVMTGNDQLGGDGEVWQYSFDGELPYSSSNDWSSEPFGYGSGILLADIDLDGMSDLIYGGWWLPVNIALGLDFGFEMDPSYTSSTSSVVEAILIADLDRDGIETTTQSIMPLEGIGSVVYLDHQVVERVLSIKKNGALLADSMYCFVPNKNWVSFRDNIEVGDNVEIEYEYSTDGDMVVSNWDANKGNYIFYNTTITSTDELLAADQFDFELAPNPTSAEVRISLKSENSEDLDLSVLDIHGRTLMNFEIGKTANSLTVGLDDLAAGTYFFRITGKGIQQTKKLLLQK